MEQNAESEQPAEKPPETDKSAEITEAETSATDTAEVGEEPVMESESGPDKEPETMLTDTAEVGQKVADILLGTVVLVGETATQAVEILQKNGPGWLENLEEKGRPVREQMSEWLRTNFSQPFRDWGYEEAAEADKKTPDTGESGDAADTSAEDQISVLERRVRELEKQVSGRTPDTDSVPPISESEAVASETPGEPTTEIVMERLAQTEAPLTDTYAMDGETSGDSPASPEPAGDAEAVPDAPGAENETGSSPTEARSAGRKSAKKSTDPETTEESRSAI